MAEGTNSSKAEPGSSGRDHTPVPGRRYSVDDANWRDLLLASPLGVVVHDRDGQVVSANAAFARLLGYDVEEVHELAVSDIVHPDDRAERDRTAAQMFNAEIATATVERRLLHKSGAIVWVRAHKSTTYVDGEPLVLVCLQDLRPERDRLEHLAFAATHDPLTGLRNRAGLFAHLEYLVAQGGGATLAMIDLNNFKGLNDTLGHAAGDRVLRRLAARLTDSAPAGAIVSRLAGDEFVVVAHRGSGEALRQQLRRCLATAIPAAPGQDYSATAAIGIIPVEPGATPEDLLDRVDRVMYQDKPQRRPT